MTKYHPGHRFGMLTLVKIDKVRYKGLVECGYCGKLAEFYMSALITGKNTDCGCQKGNIIYFIKVEDYVKIGRTDEKRLATRVSMVQTDCPYEVELLRTISGDRSTEKALHKWYKPLHHKGEWFVYDEEMRTITKEELPNWTEKEEAEIEARIDQLMEEEEI